MQIMSPNHARWDEFCLRLEEKKESNITGEMVEFLIMFALGDMGFDDESIWASIEYLDKKGVNNVIRNTKNHKNSTG